MLEFVTLVVLRNSETGLKREFRVPGGLAGAISVGVFPLLVLGLAVVHGGNETVLGMNGLVFGTVIIFAGFVVYLGTAKLRRRTLRPAIVEHVEAA
jgi:amino acid transporter